MPVRGLPAGDASTRGTAARTVRAVVGFAVRVRCNERSPEPGLTRSKYRQGVRSFRALQSKDVSDDKQWLTFWLLYTLFDLACFVGDMVGWILPVPCPAQAS